LVVPLHPITVTAQTSFLQLSRAFFLIHHKLLLPQHLNALAGLAHQSEHADRGLSLLFR